MTEFEPTPSDAALERVRDRWRDETDTFERVYDTVLGITDPTSARDVASVADCSPTAAKKHLERLVEIGIVRVDRTGRATRYLRNDGYLEWREASRIAEELTGDAIVDRIRDLEQRRGSFEDRFGTSDPTSVTLDGSDHDLVHERLEDIREWRGVVRDIRLYELAHHLVENDGHLISA